MYQYTLFFANGETMGFENDQSIDEIIAILNGTPDTFINIGTAALVQRLEIVAIVDESQAERFYNHEYEF